MKEYRENTDRQRPSRRAFLITSASACGALALWSLQSPRPASAAGGGSKTPGMVTIVEFGANGKKTGKARARACRQDGRRMAEAAYPRFPTR